MANISHFTQTVNGVSTTYDIHDANAVDLTSNQTVGGIKTFSNAPVVNSINLDGKTIDTDANDNLTYDSHIVETIEEQGEGYIRYSSGLQICYGKVTNNNNIATGKARYSYPMPFSKNPIIVATPVTEGLYFVTANTFGTSNWTLISILAYDGIRYTADGITVNYVSIGKWK